MFEKEITRDIKGLLKLDKMMKNIYQELDEYVVTNELLHHMGISLNHIKRYYWTYG